MLGLDARERGRHPDRLAVRLEEEDALAEEAAVRVTDLGRSRPKHSGELRGRRHHRRLRHPAIDRRLDLRVEVHPSAYLFRSALFRTTLFRTA